MYNFKTNGFNYEIRTIEEGIFRFRIAAGDTFGESLMSRYNILQESGEIPAEVSQTDDSYTVTAAGASLCVNLNDGSLTLNGAKEPVKLTFDGYQNNPYHDKGFTIGVSLTPDERLFGLGDESRKSIARRGTSARLDMRNIVSYGPIPYVMSSLGWGLLVNCTYAHTYDLGKTDPNRIIIESHKGYIDLYIFVPASHTLPDIIDLYTRVSGRPIVLPKFAYGFTFVMNEQTNAREMLWDCKMFRREDIPCDVIGLEPQWMTRHYDTSPDKKWDEDRFYIPGWLPDNQSGEDTFFYTLREMGFRFSLWLCQNYDLLWEEERQAGELAKKLNKEYSYEGASILDPHFACPMYQDGLTRKDEPWFKHLEKFVDNGASAFKLDGAFQCNDHPDRLWAGKYFDDEVHNIYPVIYVKQMQEGFTNYTEGRRAFIYTSCLYAGTQRYAASWAGDTGGGFDTVVAMLNFGLSGHTNVTCDMEVTSKEGIHYGFFAPWSQQLGWRNWHQPWFLRDELEDMMRYYGKLRSAMFPYIYSMAHKAASSGMPITRALSLMYPDKPEYDYVTNCYMFGDSLLVAVFDMKVTLPEGKWIDYFTGDVYEGGRVIDYKIPEGRGGALMVKAGSVFATMDPVPYLEKAEPDKYYVNVYHGADASFTLVEDDGYTYDYINGGCAKTLLSIENSSDNSLDIVIGSRSGSFTGRAKREGDAYKESDPDIRAMGTVTAFEVILHTAQAKRVTLAGKDVEFTVNDGKTMFTVPADIHEKGDLRYSVVL